MRRNAITTADLSPKARAKAEALAVKTEAVATLRGWKMKPKGKRLPSDAEKSLAVQLRSEGIGFMREHRFAPPRKWRFDFILVAVPRVAIEVEGGVWTRGRHTRGSGFVEDCAKYNEAACRGWIVLRVPSQWVHDGTAMRYIKRLL